MVIHVVLNKVNNLDSEFFSGPDLLSVFSNLLE